MAHPADGFVLAVDLGGTKTALAALTADGAALRRAVLPTRAGEGADAVVARVVRRGRALIAETEADGPRCVGVGAVSPGVVREDRVLLAPNNPGWDRLPLARTLRAGFGTDAVAAGNDVKAGALAEARSGALAGSRCGIYLNLGTGLAVAVVVGGTVLHGAHGAAGEIAYQLPGVADLPAAAAAGGRAPLEEHVSGRALAVRGSALLGREADTAEVFAAADLKPEIARLVDDALDTLAVQIANLAAVLDPDRVVAGGGMLRGDGGQRVLERIRTVLERVVPFPPEVRRAVHEQDAPLLGAGLLGWDAAAGTGRG